MVPGDFFDPYVRGHDFVKAGIQSNDLDFKQPFLLGIDRVGDQNRDYQDDQGKVFHSSTQRA
jgi:hypothetical protein